MEYQLLMGLDAAKAWDENLKEYMWQLKNPVLDQPRQKWFTGEGVYKVLKPFHGLNEGDNILLLRYCHNRIVKLATPTEKQVFFNYECLNPEAHILNRAYFSADMKFTPEEWQTLLRPVTKQEMKALMPHLSTYIKSNWQFKSVIKNKYS